jgi:dinuclear metal center YbgI/SA1388 family protein
VLACRSIEVPLQSEAVIQAIESAADPKQAADWDASGIQVAGRTRSVQRLAVLLDPIPEVVKRALGWGADLLLSHHPLSLSPRLPSRLDSYHEVLRLLFQSDAWLYAAHTSLDVRTSGPPAWLARSLCLSHVAPLVPLSPESGGGTSSCGYGLIGDLPSPLDWAALQAELSRLLEQTAWTQAGAAPRSVSRLAYCPGSGMSLAETAFASGAQVFLSGDLKYHQAQELEPLGLTLDVGHFILEEKMMAFWAEELQHELGSRGVDVAFFPGRNPMSLHHTTHFSV